MIGGPGEGWPLAMTVVSHEREPGELGYVARYTKLVNDLGRRCGGSRRGPAWSRSAEPRMGDRGGRDVAAARAAATPVRLSASTGSPAWPGGLGRQTPDDLGRAGGGSRRTRHRRDRPRVVETTPGSTWTLSTVGRRASWVAHRRSNGTSWLAGFSDCRPRDPDVIEVRRGTGLCRATANGATIWRSDEFERRPRRARGSARRSGPHHPTEPTRSSQRNESRAAQRARRTLPADRRR